MADVITRFKVESEEYKREIGKAKKELDGFSKVGKSTKAVLRQLDNAIGTNVSGLLKMGGVLGTVGLAFGALNKAIKSSQTTVDEYGRCMESVTSVVDNFFSSITSGSFDSFIDGLKDVIQNARDAYDALDNLGTFNIYNTKVTAEFDKRRAELRANIRKGVNVDDSKKKLQELEQEENRYYKEQAKVNRNAANARLMEYTGVGLDVLKPYLKDASGQERALAEAARLEKMETSKDPLVRTNYYTQNIDKKVAALKKFGKLVDDKLQNVMTDLANADRAETTMFNMQASDQRLMNYKGSGGSTGRIGRGGSSSTPLVDRLNFSVGIITEDERTQMLVDELARKNTPSIALELKWAGKDADLSALEKAIGYEGDNTKTPSFMKKPKPLDDNGQDEKEKGLRIAEKTLNSITSVAGGIRDLGIEIPSGIDKTLSMLGTIITIAEAIEALQTIGSILPFHNGGVVHAARGVFVPGATNGGRDTVPAILSPGELVLNHAQQSNLAAQLQGGGIGNLQLETSISAETIRILLNNNSRRSGRGEYVTEKSHKSR